MKYDKKPADFDTQLEMLKQRGLIINDEDTALKFLTSVSYFRMTSYWRLFETDTTSHQFVSGTHIEDIISLYDFDKKLRTIIFTAIQDIEVALRTRIIHFFSLRHGAFWFMDASKFLNHSIYQTCLDNLQNELKRSREEFIQDHFTRYASPSMPPVWKTLEVVSFGNLSKLYANIKGTNAKKEVSKSMGLPKYDYMESWMRSLTVLRNSCAHHSRIWNRRFPTMPQLPNRLPLTWVDTSHIRPMKLYAQLCTILYLEQSILPNSNIKQQLLALFSDYPNVSLRNMGFPHGWQNEPLWA